MPAAVAIPALVGGATSIAGGMLGSNASQKASQVQADAGQHVADLDTTAATNAQQGMSGAVGGANSALSSAYGQQLADFAPYLGAGTGALQQLATGLAPGGSLAQPYGKSFTSPTGVDEQNDPGYQFRLQQGQQALERSAAAKGTATGGAAMKAAQRFGQDYGSNEYSNVYNRALQNFGTNYNVWSSDQNNQFSRLSALAGMGQSAANSSSAAAQNWGNLTGGNLINGAQYTGNAGLQGAQMTGDALMNAANARASGYMGSANAWGSALPGIGRAATSLLGMLAKGGSGSGGSTVGSSAYNDF